MSDPSKTPVAIIVLNWNGLSDTLECLSSLTNLEYSHHKVFVVDNCSDEDLSPLLDHYPEATLILNRENYGYAKGNNIGLNKVAALGYEYCWVLNNDTKVAADSLSRMVDALERQPDVGAVTNLITFYEQPNLAWFAGGVLDGGLPAHRGYYRETGTLDDSTHTDYLSGCSFLARTAVLLELSGFDEQYFCYVEDVDLSLRMLDAGWQIKYVPDAIVRHKVSRSTGSLSPVKIYYKRRNMVYFFKRHRFPASTVMEYRLSSLKSMVSLAIKYRKPRAAWSVGRAMIDATLGRMGKRT